MNNCAEIVQASNAFTASCSCFGSDKERRW